MRSTRRFSVSKSIERAAAEVRPPRPGRRARPARRAARRRAAGCRSRRPRKRVGQELRPEAVAAARASSPACCVARLASSNSTSVSRSGFSISDSLVARDAREAGARRSADAAEAREDVLALELERAEARCFRRRASDQRSSLAEEVGRVAPAVPGAADLVAERRAARRARPVTAFASFTSLPKVPVDGSSSTSITCFAGLRRSASARSARTRSRAPRRSRRRPGS